MPRMGYTRIEEIATAGWVVAQKPEGPERDGPPAPVPAQSWVRRARLSPQAAMLRSWAARARATSS